jgi:NAD(P)-dependent dehydrogenase (short-subunit alcohol dehydrogenase family)
MMDDETGLVLFYHSKPLKARPSEPESLPILDDPEKRNWVLSRIPMARTGELDDFFGPVVFLASEASNFVNGHVLLVDGGWIAA